LKLAYISDRSWILLRVHSLSSNVINIFNLRFYINFSRCDIQECDPTNVIPQISSLPIRPDLGILVGPRRSIRNATPNARRPLFITPPDCENIQCCCSVSSLIRGSSGFAFSSLEFVYYDGLIRASMLRKLHNQSLRFPVPHRC